MIKLFAFKFASEQDDVIMMTGVNIGDYTSFRPAEQVH